jgi:hypothetical protein
MRLMNMEAAAGLVCEKSLDAEALLLQATRLLGCRQLADQIQELLRSFGPTT